MLNMQMRTRPNIQVSSDVLWPSFIPLQGTKGTKRINRWTRLQKGNICFKLIKIMVQCCSSSWRHVLMTFKTIQNVKRYLSKIIFFSFPQTIRRKIENKLNMTSSGMSKTFGSKILKQCKSKAFHKSGVRLLGPSGRHSTL